MTEIAVLDRAFQVIMRRLVETGRAPHYTELAKTLGTTMAQGREILHALIDRFVPSWLFPETDYITSFPPFNNLPTQYRITVRGEQKWFAQCGFEALSMTWVFPGEAVRVDAPCLDCGELIVVEMLDGRFLQVDPVGTIGHLNTPWIVVKAKLPFI